MDDERLLVDGKSVTQIASIVVSAGRMAERFRKDSQLEVLRKSLGNFVTQADVAIEDYLKEQLGKLDERIGFIAEESTSNDDQQCFWAIDPIDGTGNYLSGFPYAISVALVEDGMTCLAMIFDPERDELWFGIRGGGAFRLRNASEASLLESSSLVGLSEPIKLLATPDLEGNVIFGMPYDRAKTARILEYVEVLSKSTGDIKRIGPASLDICRVSAGQAVLYLELDLEVWDYAAGELILEEAGGVSLHCNELSLFGTKEMVELAKRELLSS